jgi:hypothetical protein
MRALEIQGLSLAGQKPGAAPINLGQVSCRSTLAGVAAGDPDLVPVTRIKARNS